MTTALIDGDLVAYINAASAENDPLEVALMRVEGQMSSILATTNTIDYKVWISGSDNFRYSINPEYKANRKAIPPPRYLQECREYLVKFWYAKITEGYETDDALGINQNEDTIICSIDKDMLQIPGKHYRWPILRGGKEVRAATFVDIPYIDGLRYFYKQMLIGDTSDNIIGVSKIGQVKADKIISPLNTESEMVATVRELYNENLPRFNMNADCLWIMRNENEKYSDRIPQ